MLCNQILIATLAVTAWASTGQASKNATHREPSGDPSSLVPVEPRFETDEDRYAERRHERLVAGLMKRLQPQFNRDLREIERRNGGRIVSPQGFRITDTSSHTVVFANGKTCEVMGAIIQDDTSCTGKVYSWNCE